MDTQNRIDHKTLLGDDYIEVWISAFLVAKKSENLVKGSIDFYQKRLKVFTNFLDGQEAKFINQITPNLIRDFLLFLEEKGHNSGGVHGYFRTIKTFLRWYWEEAEPDGKNPINKVKTPRNPEKSIQGITRDEFDTLLTLCSKNNFMGERDRTILMVLMDTGVRADELCNIQLEDINLIENSILIKQGKGRKPRFVFIGKRTRKQIRKYLKFRGTEGTYLFINRSEDKLVYNALRQILRRLGSKAGINGISPHDFRRGFCLECLRNGMDLLTLSRIMGHTSLQLLSRYAKQSTVDLGNKYKSVIDD